MSFSRSGSLHFCATAPTTCATRVPHFSLTGGICPAGLAGFVVQNLRIGE